MVTEIHNWVDIADEFQDTLVLGNGASIAIDSGFNYSSLLDKARKQSLITSTLDGLFDNMKSDDFELVLHHVSIAESINRVLGIKDGKTHDAYENIRTALIQTVQEIHPEHGTVKHDLKPAYEFMQRFRTVVSLNYDLLVYWAMMLGNEETTGQGPDKFKDCFVSGHFSTDCLRNEIEKKQSTLVFYPHGNLALAADHESGEFKIASGKDVPLLDAIVNTWEGKACTPLFVAEGDSEQKLKAIRRSTYLSTVYDDVLPSLTETVAVYGWSFDKKDKHLLERICKGKSKIAISVHGNNETNGDSESWCGSVSQKIHNINSGAEIQFYSAESPDCWIHRLQEPVLSASR